MKKIIYTRADGGLSVVHPAETARLVQKAIVGGVTHLFAPPMAYDRVLVRFKDATIDSIEWAETEDAFVDRIRVKDVPVDAPNVQVVDESAVPTDRTFRNAWKAGQGKVDHDMAKCREIHKDRLRQVRAPKLVALDVEYMRALELGDTTLAASVAAKKQALRDITNDPAITAAKTPDELKSVMPTALRA